MSLPVLFFTAPVAIAPKVRTPQHKLSAEDVFLAQNLDPLMLTILWSAVREEEWDETLEDEFDEVYAGEDDSTHQLPEEFTRALAELSPAQLRAAAETWSETEEVGLSVKEAQRAVKELQRLAKRAVAAGQPVYLYTSV